MASESAPSSVRRLPQLSAQRQRFKPVTHDLLSRVIYTQTYTALKPLRNANLDDPKALGASLAEHRSQLATVVSTISAADTEAATDQQKLAINLGKLTALYSNRLSAPLNLARNRPQLSSQKTTVLPARKREAVPFAPPEKKIKDEPLDDDEPCCSKSYGATVSANETLSSLLDAQLRALTGPPPEPMHQAAAVTVVRASAPGTAPVKVVAKRNCGAAARVVAVRRPATTSTLPSPTVARPTVVSPTQRVAAPSTQPTVAFPGQKAAATTRPVILTTLVAQRLKPRAGVATTVAPKLNDKGAAGSRSTLQPTQILRYYRPPVVAVAGQTVTATTRPKPPKMFISTIPRYTRPADTAAVPSVANGDQPPARTPPPPPATVLRAENPDAPPTLASTNWAQKLSKRLRIQPNAAYGICDVEKPEVHPAHACPYCGLMIEGAARLEHVKEAHPDRYTEFTPFICILKECDYRSTSRVEVKKHCHQVHSPLFDLWQAKGRFNFDVGTMCPLCPRPFYVTTLMHLRTHVIDMHDTVMPTMLCSVCCETCTTTSELFLHWLHSPFCDGTAKLLDCREESFLA